MRITRDLKKGFFFFKYLRLGVHLITLPGTVRYAHDPDRHGSRTISGGCQLIVWRHHNHAAPNPDGGYKANFGFVYNEPVSLSSFFETLVHSVSIFFSFISPPSCTFV